MNRFELTLALSDEKLQEIKEYYKLVDRLLQPNEYLTDEELHSMAAIERYIHGVTLYLLRAEIEECPWH